MPPILDAAPYPWHRPEAMQLYQTLVQLYPTTRAADLVAKRAGLDTAMIYLEQAAAFVWKEILEAAATAGRLKDLVQTSHDITDRNSPARPFLADLLAGRHTSVSGEQRTVDGAPRFVASTDDVTEPEALLFQDDLTMQIGRVPGLIATLQRLVALAPAVCKLTVDIDGDSQYGTGFRIGPNLLLTNWHVVHRRSDGRPATAVTAEFDFEDDGRGGLRAATPIPCDAGSIVAYQADDWATVLTRQPMSDAWPAVPLAGAAQPVEGAPAYVIQHPGGGGKRVGFVRNQVSYVDDRVVHYLTDTQIGSSGAPVFDAQGRIVALHHAGGRPQEVLGKPVLRKNEGIRISRVTAGLLARGVPVPGLAEATSPASLDG